VLAIIELKRLPFTIKLTLFAVVGPIYVLVPFKVKLLVVDEEVIFNPPLEITPLKTAELPKFIFLVLLFKSIFPVNVVRYPNPPKVISPFMTTLFATLLDVIADARVPPFNVSNPVPKPDELPKLKIPAFNIVPPEYPLEPFIANVALALFITIPTCTLLVLEEDLLSAPLLSIYPPVPVPPNVNVTPDP